MPGWNSLVENSVQLRLPVRVLITNSEDGYFPGLDGRPEALVEPRLRNDLQWDDWIGARDRLSETGNVVAWFGAQQKTNGARAKGERGRDGFETDLCDFVNSER